MGLHPPSQPHDPGFWRELARLVVAGDLQGLAAEEAVVDLITASEVGPADHPRMRVEIRRRVQAIVRDDRELCALLAANAGTAESPEPVALRAASQHSRTPVPEALPEEPPVTNRAGSTRERARPPTVPRRPDAARKRPARPTRERRETTDPDTVEAFAAGQTRKRVLAVVGIAAVLAALYGAWAMLRETPCDRLARKACLTLDDCALVAVLESLKAEGIGSDTCEATLAAIDEALAGVDPAKARPIFARVMVEQLGFDPRGEAVAARKPAAGERQRSESVAIVEGVSTMSDLFADEAHLVWTRHAPPGVFRVRSIGGTPEVLAEHPDPVDVVATRDFVYWLSRDPAGAKLWTDKKRGEYDPAVIEVEGFSPVHAAFMGPELAFVDGTTGAIVMAAVAGGEPRTIAPGELPAPTAITADDTNVYWATAAGMIATVPRAGGQTRVLAEGVREPAGLAPDPTHLYWIDRGQGVLARVSKEGGAVETLVTGRPGLWDLAIDGDRVHATDREAGMVLSIGKADGALTVSAEGQSQPSHIAVDGAAVYWEAGGMLHRLPK